MNHRIHSTVARFLSLAGFLVLLSCDGREASSTASSDATVTLSPRIALANGDSVPKVEFVRIIVTLDGNSTPFKDTMVDFRLHSLAVPGVPVGSNYRIDAMGLCAAADGRHFPVLWQGSQSGSAKANLGPVQWKSIGVYEKDTTSPSLKASGLPDSGDVVLAYGSSVSTRTFQVSASDTVYVGTLRISPKDTASGIATYELRLAKDSNVVVAVVSPRNTVSLRTYRVLVSTDPASDTTKPSIAFVRPSSGDTVFTTTQTTYKIEVLPTAASGIDSVVISCGGRRTRLTKAPWSVVVNLDPGSNPVTDTVFASNKRIAFGSATLTNPVSGGDSKPPLIRLVGPSRTSDTVDWKVRSILLRWKISDSSGVSGAWLEGQISSNVGSDSTWSTLQPLKYGRNVFRLIAKDVPGNSDTDSVVVVRREDQRVPTIVRGSETYDRLLPANTKVATLTWHVNDSDGVPLVAVNGVLAGETRDGLNVVVSGGPDSVKVVVNVTFGSLDSINLVLAARDSSGREADDGICLRLAQQPRVVRTSFLKSADTVAFDSVHTHPTWIIGRTRGLSTMTLRINTDTAIVSCKDTVCTAAAPLATKENNLKLVVRDSAGDSTTDVFSVFRRFDASAPVVAWLGKNADRKDTVAMGTNTWLPKWKVTAKSDPTVSIDGGTIAGANNEYGKIVLLRRSARSYDTIVRLVATAANIPVSDSAILHVSGSTIRPVVNVVGSRDVVVGSGQTIFQSSWTVTDSTLDSVTIDGVKVRLSNGKFSRSDSISSKRDTFLIRLVATDSGGLQAFDSIRVRKLRPPVASPGSGSYSEGQTVLATSNLPDAVLSWSNDRITWNPGSTISVNHSQRLYVKGVLGGVSVIDSAFFRMDPTITSSWDERLNAYVVAVSDSGADAIEYSLGSNDWTPYRSPVNVALSTRFAARSKLGNEVSNTVFKTISAPPKFTPKWDSVYADSVTVLVRANGLCDSMTYSIDGALATTKTNCQADIPLTVTSSVKVTTWLDEMASAVNYVYRITHDTSLVSVSLGSGMPAVAIGSDGSLIVADSLPIGTRSVMVTAIPGNSNAVVTFNEGASGALELVNGTLSVTIAVQSSLATQRYRMNLVARKGGSFIDSRDDQSYRMVRIGSQIWMAQNLNYRNTTGSVDTVGTCTENVSSNCVKYGRLYRWHEAMGVAEFYDTVRLNPGAAHRGICPSGWHVPSDDEWGALRVLPGDLAAKGSMWTLPRTDDYGFGILPGGYADNTGSFLNFGSYGYFWSATETSRSGVWTDSKQQYFSDLYEAHLESGASSKTLGMSVRCIAD